MSTRRFYIETMKSLLTDGSPVYAVILQDKASKVAVKFECYDKDTALSLEHGLEKLLNGRSLTDYMTDEI